MVLRKTLARLAAKALSDNSKNPLRPVYEFDYQKLEPRRVLNAEFSFDGGTNSVDITFDGSPDDGLAISSQGNDVVFSLTKGSWTDGAGGTTRSVDRSLLDSIFITDAPSIQFGDLFNVPSETAQITIDSGLVISVTGDNFSIAAGGTLTSDLFFVNDGDVTFQGAVDGANDGTGILDFQNGGTRTFLGDIGATHSIEQFSTSGAVQFAGNELSATGDVHLTSLLLSQNLTINANDVIVNDVDGNSNQYSLTIVSHDLVNDVGDIEYGSSLNLVGLDITTETGQTTLFENVTTSGDQSYQTDLLLDADVDMVGNDISLTGTVRSGHDSGDPGYALSIETQDVVGDAGVATVNGVMGTSGAELSSLSVTNAALGADPLAGHTQLGGQILTKGNSVTFSGPVVLVADTTITETGAGNVTFESTVDSTASQYYTLAVTTFTGDAVFQSNVGTGGDQELGALTLSSIDPGTMNPSTGRSVLGDASPILLETKAANAQSGDMTFHADVVLNQNTTLVGNDIVFNARIDAADHAAADFGASLTIQAEDATGDAGVVTLAGAIGLFGTLDNDATTNTELSSLSVTNSPTGGNPLAGYTELGAEILTKGNSVTFNSPVILVADTTLTELGAGDVSFLSTVDSSVSQFYTLSVTTNTGNIVLAGDVGTGTDQELGALTLSSVDPVTSNPSTGRTVLGNAASVTLETRAANAQSGDMTFNAAVVLNQDATLVGNDVTFNSTIDAADHLATAAGFALHVTSEDVVGDAGAVTFNGDVGLSGTLDADPTTNSELTALTVTNLAAGGNPLAGFTQLGGDVLAKGSTVTFVGPVVLAADTTITELGAGHVTFESTVDSTANQYFTLTVTTNMGHARFWGNVGAGTDQELGALTVSSVDPVTLTPSTGRVELGNASSVSLATKADNGKSGDMTFHTDVVLNQNTTIVGNDVIFNGRIDAADHVDAAPGFSLSVTTEDATGDAGVASFMDDIGLTGTLDADPNTNTELTAFSVTNTALGANPLAGYTELNGDILTEGNSVTFNAPLVLMSDTVINEAGLGTVSFLSTVDSQPNQFYSLTVTTVDGDITFAGDVGNGGANRALGFIDVSSSGTGRTILGGAAAITINTSSALNVRSDQLYQNPVELANDVVINANDVTFQSTIDSVDHLATQFGYRLTINAFDELGDDGLTLLQGDLGLAGTLDADPTTNTELRALTVNSNPYLANPLAGYTELSGDILSKGNSVTFNSPLVLAANTTITEIGVGDVTFQSTVDSTANQYFSLTVTTFTGNTEFWGDVGTGANQELGGLTTSSTDPVTLTPSTGQTHLGNAAALTIESVAGGGNPGNVTFNNNVVLEQDVTIDAVNVTFNANLNAATAGVQGAQVNASGISTFGDATADRVGNTGALEYLRTDAAGSTRVNAGGVTTTDDQTYQDHVVLGSDVTFAATAAATGDITFNGNLNAAVAGNQGATVNAANLSTFGDAAADGVGNLAALEFLRTSAAGTTIIVGATVTTTDDQTYGDDVILNNDVTFTASDPTDGDITFNGDLDAAAAGVQSATVNAAAVSTFGNAAADAVGGAAALRFLRTDAAGSTRVNSATVNTTDDQTFNDDVVLGSDVTFSATNAATGDISFNGDLNAATAGNQGAILNAQDQTTIGNAAADSVGNTAALQFLRINAPGTTRINAGIVTTTEDQVYHENVTLGSDVTFTASNAVSGDITFNGNLDAAAAGVQGATVNAESVSTFGDAAGDAVGGTNALQFLRTGAPGTTRFNAATVTTTEDQTYDDNVVLGTDLTFTATNAALGDVIFNANLDAATAGVQGAQVDAQSQSRFGNAVGDTVGSTAALEYLRTNAAGTTRVDAGSVTTTTDQTYNDAVVVGSDVTFTATAAATGDITFNQNLDAVSAGNDGVTVNAQDQATFGNAAVDAVGSTSALEFLRTNGPGTTTFFAANVTTADDQTYNENVVLQSDVTFNATNAGSGHVRFNEDLNAAAAGVQGATVNAQAQSRFGNAAGDGVGNTAALQYLRTDAPGTTRVNAATINTTADQTFNDDVVLGSDVTFTATNAGTGDVTFNGDLDAATAGNQGAIVNAQDRTTIGDAAGDSVGNTAALEFLRINTPGSTRINAGMVTTTADQTYHEDVTLGSDVTFTATNAGTGDITFNGNLNAAAAGVQGADVNAQSQSTFGDAAADGVGNVNALEYLRTNVPGVTRFNAATVTTTDQQVYQDDVVLGNDVIFTASNPGTGDISFNADLDAATAGVQGAEVNAQSQSTFGNNVGDAVGNSRALQYLRTNAAGSTHVGAGNVTTTEDQTYNDRVILDSDVTFSATNAGTGDVTFNQDLNAAVAGTQGATVNAQDQTTFGDAAGDAVGNSQALQFLRTNGPGSTRFNAASVTTTADQTYNEDVVLGNSVTFTATNAVTGDITFNEDLNASAAGVQGANVNAQDRSTFGNAAGDGVGNVAALQFLRTNAAGTTRFNASNILTTADQTYRDDVLLGNDITFTASNGGTGDISFLANLNAVTAGVQGAQVNAQSVSTFGDAAGDAVGGNAALAFLRTNAAGSTVVSAGGVTTTTDQTYLDSVFLGSDVTFRATNDANGNILFHESLNGLTVGNEGATLVANGMIQLGDNAADNIGDLNELEFINVRSDIGDAAQNTEVYVSNIRTQGGDQIYQDDVVLHNNLSINAAAPNPLGNVIFAQQGGPFRPTVHDQSLVIVAAGETHFSNSDNLTSLQINARDGVKQFAGTIIEAGQLAAQSELGSVQLFRLASTTGNVAVLAGGSDALFDGQTVNLPVPGHEVLQSSNDPHSVVVIHDGNLTVDTVGGVSGVTAAGNVYLKSGGAALNGVAALDLNINQDVSTSSGKITVIAEQSININGGATITYNDGTPQTVGIVSTKDTELDAFNGDQVLTTPVVSVFDGQQTVGLNFLGAATERGFSVLLITADVIGQNGLAYPVFNNAGDVESFLATLLASAGSNDGLDLFSFQPAGMNQQFAKGKSFNPTFLTFVHPAVSPNSPFLETFVVAQNHPDINLYEFDGVNDQSVDANNLNFRIDEVENVRSAIVDPTMPDPLPPPEPLEFGIRSVPTPLPNAPSPYAEQVEFDRLKSAVTFDAARKEVYQLKTVEEDPANPMVERELVQPTYDPEIKIEVIKQDIQLNPDLPEGIYYIYIRLINDELIFADVYRKSFDPTSLLESGSGDEISQNQQSLTEYFVSVTSPESPVAAEPVEQDLDVSVWQERWAQQNPQLAAEAAVLAEDGAALILEPGAVPPQPVDLPQPQGDEGVEHDPPAAADLPANDQMTSKEDAVDQSDDSTRASLMLLAGAAVVARRRATPRPLIDRDPETRGECEAETSDSADNPFSRKARRHRRLARQRDA